MVCAEEVTKFPFDVQHQRIIRYKKGSPRDFEKFKNEVSDRIEALLSNDQIITKLSDSPIKKIEGLTPQEIMALVSIMQNRDSPESGVALHHINDDMEKAGFTQFAARMALTTLAKERMINFKKTEGYNDYFYEYFLAEAGENWLISNQDQLNLRILKNIDNKNKKHEEVFDEEIPF